MYIYYQWYNFIGFKKIFFIYKLFFLETTYFTNKDDKFSITLRIKPQMFAEFDEFENRQKYVIFFN